MWCCGMFEYLPRQCYSSHGHYFFFFLFCLLHKICSGLRVAGFATRDLYWWRRYLCIFLWLLLGVKGELVVPNPAAVSGGSAWGQWGDHGKCCFSKVSVAHHSSSSQRLNPERWTKTCSSAWFVPHASALSASLIMQS